MKKLILLLFLGISISLSSCSYVNPQVSKAIEEGKQTDLMAKQNELLEKQNVILDRIAVALEKK